MATDLGGLVDAENSLIRRRVFIEPEIYQLELERTTEALDWPRQACAR